MSALDSIPLQESVLFRKMFPSRKALRAHLSEYLKEDDESRIFVVQFEEHLPTIEDVSERDWFLEALGAAAAAVALYEFIEKRLKGKLPMRTELVKERVPRRRTKYRTVVTQVTRPAGGQLFVQQVPQQVPYQEEYIEEVEEIRQIQVSSVGGVEIVEIDRVVRRIRRLEIYTRTGEVSAAEFAEEE